MENIAIINAMPMPIPHARAALTSVDNVVISMISMSVINNSMRNMNPRSFVSSMT